MYRTFFILSLTNGPSVQALATHYKVFILVGEQYKDFTAHRLRETGAS